MTDSVRDSWLVDDCDFPCHARSRHEVCFFSNTSSPVTSTITMS